MCIRDSTCTSCTQAAAAQALLLDLPAPALLPLSWGEASVTLCRGDVYKRQAQEIEDVIGIEAMDAPRISAKTGLNIEDVLEPVSYTHLDVYKRQVYTE